VEAFFTGHEHEALSISFSLSFSLPPKMPK